MTHIPEKKPIIVFDFDDVLIDVTKGFLQFYKDRKEFVVDYEKIETDISLLMNITGEEELKLWDKFFVSEEYLSLSPNPQTLEVLEKLKERFELVILTNRVDRFRQSAISWIEKHTPNYFSKVLFAPDFPKEKRSKGQICVDLGTTLLVDDEPKNILSCVEYNVPVVVYDSPWNRKLPKELPRIKSLKEIEEFIK